MQIEKKLRVILLICLAVSLSAQALRAGYYEQGRAYYTHKKYDKAKEMFLKAVDSSEHGDAYYFLGEVEKLQGNYHEAEEYYKTAVTKKNISRQYLINSFWNAIVLAEQREDYQGVMRLCREMKVRTGDASARQKAESIISKFLWTDDKDAIDRYNAGIDLKKSGKPVEAMKKFQDALSLAPSFLAAKFEIGMIAYNRGDLDLTANYLGDIASKLPFYAEVHLILADIYFAKHNYRSAIDHFDKALDFGLIDSATEYRIRIKRGTCYYNINNFQDAESDIEKALHHNKKSVEALLLLSAVKIKMGKYPDALKTLKRADSSSPNNPEVLYQIGSVYYKENDAEYAVYFDKLFSLAGGKKNYPAKYNKVFIMLAKSCFEEKRYGRVVAIVKTLNEKSLSYDARLLAAKASYQLKEYDAAIDYFEKISLGNEDKFTLCKAYALSGRREKAKITLSVLMQSGEYASKARQDPALSGIVKEIEKDKTIIKPEIERESEGKNLNRNIKPEKNEPAGDAKSDDEEE